MFTLLILCICFPVYGKAAFNPVLNERDDSEKFRLLDAQIAKDGQFPFMARIYRWVPKNLDETLTCDGVIIADDLILTHKECLVHPDSTDFAVIGKVDHTEFLNAILANKSCNKIPNFSCYLVENSYSYEEIDGQHFPEDDAAVIELAKPIKKSDKVFDSCNKLGSGPAKNCLVIGSGDHSTAEAEEDDFKLRYKTNVNVTVDGLYLRADGPHFCFDIGSPLICNNKLYGISSHMVLKNRTVEHCSDAATASYFIPVKKFLEDFNTCESNTPKMLKTKHGKQN